MRTHLAARDLSRLSADNLNRVLGLLMALRKEARPGVAQGRRSRRGSTGGAVRPHHLREPTVAAEPRTMARTRKGRLYVLEGPDGVGKTTLARILVRQLEGAGSTVASLSFPGREPGTLGRHVYDVHHDLARFGIDGISPESLQLLHIAAHLDSIERRIRPIMSTGVSVVLDRFWWSTWVYGRFLGADSRILDAMIDLERAAWDDITPAVIFLITRSQSLGKSKMSAHRRIATLYGDLAKQERASSAVRLIHNNGSLENVASTLMRTLTRLGLQESASTKGRDKGRASI